MIKNIVFDFDGTIADSITAILDIVNKNSERYGFDKLDKNQVKFLMGKGAKYLISYLQIPKYKVPFLLKETLTRLNDEIVNLKSFEEMPKTIQKLSEKELSLGILTTNLRENVEKFLKNNNLNYFDFTYHGSSLFGKDKMLRKMLKEQKLDKNETVYVGDEDRDVEAAKKVGIKSVAVTWGFNSKKLLKETKPDFLIDKPSGLLDILN